MNSRAFRPSSEALEDRNLLSANHHVGTIRGYLVTTETVKDDVFDFSTFHVVQASGTLRPFGKIRLMSSSTAFDHTTYVGTTNSFPHPGPTNQYFYLDVLSHGRYVEQLALGGPDVPEGTPLQGGTYSIFVYHERSNRIFGSGTATVTIPKGLPTQDGQVTPIVFKISL